MSVASDNEPRQLTMSQGKHRVSRDNENSRAPMQSKDYEMAVRRWVRGRSKSMGVEMCAQTRHLLVAIGLSVEWKWVVLIVAWVVLRC